MVKSHNDYHQSSEYWPSQGLNQQPSVLKSSTLRTEQWGLAQSIKVEDLSMLKAFGDNKLDKLNPLPYNAAF